MKVQKFVKVVVISTIILSCLTFGLLYLYQSNHNEKNYHSFGSKFGNAKLYASENVILATDMAGNELWTISPQEYGITKNFDASNINNILWVVDNSQLLPTDKSKLLIFNENGQLMWQRSFKEFIVTSNLNLTIENYLTVHLLGNREYPVECYPVSCKIDSLQEKESNTLLALNISDGKDIWNHNMNQYFTDPQQSWSSRIFVDQSKIHISSDPYKEILDSASGKTESSIDSIYIDNVYELQIDYMNKQVLYVKESVPKPLWSLDQKTDLYSQLFSQGLILNSDHVVALKTLLLIHNFPNKVDVIIDKANGKVLSSIDNGLLSFTGSFIEQDNILIGKTNYRLADMGDLFALNTKTGKILWTREYTEFDVLDGETPVVRDNIFEAKRRPLDGNYDIESIKLNIYTGKEVK